VTLAIAVPLRECSIQMHNRENNPMQRKQPIEKPSISSPEIGRQNGSQLIVVVTAEADNRCDFCTFEAIFRCVASRSDNLSPDF
jgi:hypothetical protein